MDPEFSFGDTIVSIATISLIKRLCFLWITASMLLISLIHGRDLWKPRRKFRREVDLTGAIFCRFLGSHLINRPLLKRQRRYKAMEYYLLDDLEVSWTLIWGKLSVFSYLVCILLDLWLFWRDEANSGRHGSWHAVWVWYLDFGQRRILLHMNIKYPWAMLINQKNLCCKSDIFHVNNAEKKGLLSHIVYYVLPIKPDKRKAGKKAKRPTKLRTF